MSKMPRIVAIVSIVAGAIMIVVGVAVYFVVQRELADEKIVVSDDAENFATDGLHPSAVGHEHAAREIARALRASYGIRSSACPG